MINAAISSASLHSAVIAEFIAARDAFDGAALAEFRTSRGLSQQDLIRHLAEAVGETYTQTTVSVWENGHRPIPHIVVEALLLTPPAQAKPPRLLGLIEAVRAGKGWTRRTMIEALEAEIGRRIGFNTLRAYEAGTIRTPADIEAVVRGWAASLPGLREQTDAPMASPKRP